LSLKSNKSYINKSKVSNRLPTLKTIVKIILLIIMDIFFLLVSA